MKLIITEKNIAAKKIAEILADKKPRAVRVSSTPVYKFTWNGEPAATVGLKGHILETNFPDRLEYSKRGGWRAAWDGGAVPASVPASLPTPPWDTKRKPFIADGVEIGRSWKVTALPYLVWAPILNEHKEEDIIGALQELTPDAEEVIIATDYDREGELIGADARSVVLAVNPDVPISRARYSAITKGEVTRAFSELSPLDDNLADAGGARRDIDFIWGAVLTRFLTTVKFAGMGKVRSAGRVQTPTLALIVEREDERDAFVPEDYWVLTAQAVTPAGEPFSATHEVERFKDYGQADEAYQRALAAVQSGATVVSVEQKERRAQPPMPFNTTALQAAAAAEGLSPARAMRIAESLYMNGYISYPRVDNTVYPPSLELRDLLKELQGVQEYYQYATRLLSQQKLTPTRGKKETTDHPPIHPTAPAKKDDLKPEEWKLYNLVARRFMATLSGPATIRDTEAILDLNGESFRAKGQVVVSPGFREIYPYNQKKDEELPALAADDRLSVAAVELESKQTKPPARYSEASIITAMEKKGLGTKATRHDVVQKLIDRKFVVLEDRALRPTNVGRSVVVALRANAEQITSPAMTADLESAMDEIASGRKDRTEVIDHSRSLLAPAMDALIGAQEHIAEEIARGEKGDVVVCGSCPTCGSDMHIKYPKVGFGQFLGCSAWAADGTGCPTSFPLPASGKIECLEDQCHECGAPRIRHTAFRKAPVEKCVNPACVLNHEDDIDLGPCPVCAATGQDFHVIAHRSKKTGKRFARCVNYEVCDVSAPLPMEGAITTVDELCPVDGWPQIETTNAKGTWRRCINMDCPSNEKAAGGRGRGRGASARGKAGAAGKRSAAKKPAAKKPAAKKSTAKKPAAKKSSAK